MDKRRRAGVIAASGAAILGSAGSLVATHHESSADLSDFWIGFVIGLALALLAAAVVLMMRRANDQGANGSCR
jgi:hypothetical protein